MNKPQAEGNINSRLYNRGRNSNKPFSSAAILDCMKNRMHEKKVQNCSVIKKNMRCKCYAYLMSFLLITLNWIIEGQQQRHWLIKLEQIHKGYLCYLTFNYRRFVS